MPIAPPSAMPQKPIASETRSPKRIADHMSRPWSSVPSQNRGSPPATKLGGSSESERKLVAGLKGSVGAIHGANSAARKRTEVITAAATVTFDDRKLASRSLSLKRAMNVRGGADATLGWAEISLIS